MDGLGEDPLSQPGLDRVLQDKVDPDPEQPLQERLEIHVGVERLRVELDNEVEIAPHACGAPGSGSEQAERVDTVAANGWRMRLKDSKDLGRGQVHGRLPLPWYLGWPPRDAARAVVPLTPE